MVSMNAAWSVEEKLQWLVSMNAAWSVKEKL